MKPVCVIGDYIEDTYFLCENKKNPEGNIPCYNITKKIVEKGGAANVVKNLEVLGSKVDFFYSGKRANKMRVHLGDEYVCRIDNDLNIFSRIEDKIQEEWLISHIKNNVNKYDFVVVSDYNKGTITCRVAREIMRMNAKVLVDCKPNHVKWFKGAYLWKPNLKEYKQTNKRDIKFDNVLITKGSKGMKLVSKENPFNIQSYKVKVVDVTGAGDTVIAIVTHFLNKGFDLNKACELGNIGGAVSVMKKGCYSMTEKEILKLSKKWGVVVV